MNVSDFKTLNYNLNIKVIWYVKVLQEHTTGMSQQVALNVSTVATMNV